MIKISKEQVKELAKLARIGFSAEEEESLAKEMTAILNYFKELDKVEIKNVQPTSQITGLKNVLREDRKNPSDIIRDELLTNAPEVEKGFIKVKKVLE